MAVTGPSRPFIASPDVSKVIAESGDTRVILATWKPGQRDEWHSHPANTVAYALTDCEDLRIYFPSRQSIEVQPAIQSHSFEHQTSKECKALFVERD
jgi:hypothetical protein